MILTLLISTMLLFPGAAAGRAQVKNWQVYFSPHGGCTEAVVEALGKARSTVLVQAYSFTSAPIAKALVEAHRRGVKVEVVLDRSQHTEKYSSATFLYNNGIPCYIDAQHAIAHSRVIVIDRQTVKRVCEARQKGHTFAAALMGSAHKGQTFTFWSESTFCKRRPAAPESCDYGWRLSMPA
jgi:phosphatidylserine/phosphatidylglycerophosphate/cardiolipin synthase-like enzyme